MEHLHRAASRTISGCLLSSPVPHFSEAPLPFLQVTLTHFALSSCEALRLSTFPSSGLARLGVKPRLCRSYWRAFASTYLLMLLLQLEKLSLLALPHLLEACLPSLSSPPFPLHAPALMRLSLTLTLHHLTIWCFEQTALFLSAKTALVYLPTAHSLWQ